MNHWTLENSEQLLEAAEETLRPGGLGLTEHALSLCDFSRGSRILDAGCGTAATARHLGKTGKFTAVGVDRSPSLLADGRGRSPELPLVRGELESLPFREGSFDGVICECVLSQTRPAQALTEFRRVLRPGGFLILSDLYRRSGPDEGAAEPAGHGRAATREQTAALLEGSDFETLHWEDRTKELKQLALRLIWAPGESGKNLFSWCGCSEQGAGCADWREVGYHLLIARRRA